MKFFIRNHICEDPKVIMRGKEVLTNIRLKLIFFLLQCSSL